MKKMPSLSSATASSLSAVLLLLSACGLAGDDNSPAAIRSAIEQGDFGRARALASAAYQAGNSNAETRLLAGITDLGTNDGISAQTNFEAAANAGIAPAVILPLMAEALARQGKTDAALARAAKAQSKAATAYVKGINAWRAEDPWNAREAFEAAHKIDPANHRLTLDLAQTRAELGLFADALLLAARVEKDEPRNIRAAMISGDILMRQNAFAKAAKAYDRALRISPGNGSASAAKARALYAQGQWQEADRLLTTLPPALGGREDIQLLRGKIAARQKRYNDAGTYFASAGNWLERDDEAMYLASRSFSVQGQHWKAVRMMETAIRIRPDLPEYHAALIRAYRSAGDEGAAKAHIAAIPPSVRGAKALQGI